MNWGIIAGDTNKTIYVRLRDSTTGLAKTGLAFGSAGAVASYTLPLAARAAITLATQTVTGAHSDGGFVEIDATNAKGLYRLDLPDAAVASGAFVTVSIEFDGIIEESIQIELGTRAVNVTQWAGTAAAAGATAGRPGVDVLGVSGDDNAADNLELMYDGTGYTDETGPASRSQVDGIGAASGAALNYEASADNTAGAIIDAVTIVGTITANLFGSTSVEDGVRHQLTHAANAFDFVYRLPIGGARTAATVEWRGFLTSSNDSCSMQVFDHAGVAWDTIATISGTNGSTNGNVIASLLSKHTGTGSELGNIYIRFVTTGQSSPVLNTDLLLVQAVNIGQSVGYANGRIYINTALSNTSTEPFVDGVADNPVSTIAAALTLSTSTGLTDFHIVNGSSITLAAAATNLSFFGNNWTLALGGQSMAGAYIHGATVSGTYTGAGVHFVACDMGAVTVADDARIVGSSLGGTITLVAGSVFIDVSHDAGTPVINFAAAGATTAHIHGYRGDIEFQNMAAGDVVELGGSGAVTSNANNAAGAINLRGAWALTDNGSATIEKDDNQTGVDATLVDTNELQTDWTNAGRLDTILDAIPTTAMRGTDSALLASTFTTMFAGITALAEWLGLLAGKQAADATALTEIKATGAGSGTFSETTDSLEAVRDNQSGGGGGSSFRVLGGVGRSAGNSYTFVAWLETETGVKTTGVSAPTVVGVFGNNGDTDLVATSIVTNTGSDGRFYGSFSLTTQPTDDQPAVVVISLVLATVTYRGHIDVAEVT